MGVLLKGVSGIRWGELCDARRDRAGGIPALLSRIAYADEETARLAVDDLGDLICELGFVVGEATAPAVPFLLELAGAPHTSCKADVLALLQRICRTDQWHSAAVAARNDGYEANYQEQPGWEAAARAAVHAGRPVIERLAASPHPEEAAPARELLLLMDEVPPFPKP
ncbi:hypothetical protein SAMN05216252_110160 [Actinacidiphila glaucinigra]|uniref:Uncharacterized protein n=1 Tax=Actinacidiphila glaucinigra TaxID=235986 RepID=A0A239IKH5_9ACTN|nr:hypothetical protein SAMN05216252_110160 [Actinacidiphila glaucinigra]